MGTPLITFSNTALALGCPSDQFKSAISGNCVGSYQEWLSEVWGWVLGILIGLSTLVLSAAAVVYMTSGGNPDRIKLAKKLTWGVASGIILIILARVVLVNFIGIRNTDFQGQPGTTSSGGGYSSPSGAGGGMSSGGGSGGGGGGFGAD